MTCEKLDSDFFRYNSCHDCVAPASPRVDRQLFSLPRGPRPRKLGSAPATARFARATASHSIDCPAQAVLGGVENVLVWMEEASRLGYSPKRRELAWSTGSFAPDMHLKIPTSRRAEGCQQRGSRPDLSNGCRESDLGGAAHSRRTAQAGFRSLGKECLAMDPASPERSRSREAMADVPQEPSRGHCGDGLFHCPNAHVWCSVLLFRHRPRAA